MRANGSARPRILWIAVSCSLLLVAAFGASARAEEPSSPPVHMLPLPQRDVILPVMDCTGLARQDFTDISASPATITSAAIEPAKDSRAEFCAVKGIISPQIQFELRLPTKTYTGRYLQGGCGGTCGLITNRFSPTCDQEPAFSGAFAVAFENSGHVGANMIDTLWALKAPALRRDFAERAAHVTSVVAKAVIARYYGRPPAHSYFQGCSNGGREGLKEAQRYPSDFDGIVVGAPAYWITLMPLRTIWESQHGLDAEGKPILTKQFLALLHHAVLDTCDALDGLKDGQIDDGRTCHFDPATLVCKSKQAKNCVTRQQADVMQAYYSGPVDAQGRQLYLGGEPYGSELNWLDAFSLMGSTLGAQQMKYMTYDGNPPPDFNWRTWKPDAAALADLFKHGGYYNANDPDLRAFRAAGGKLIIWQGGADNAAGAYGMFDYYQRVRDTLGGFRGTQPFMRVFLVPGVYHCGGGYVPYQEDYLGAMVNWVEKSEAPDKVLSTAILNDGTIRERPLYAYPVRAKYKGSGDINRPESFSPVRPAAEPADRYDWLGANMQ